MKLTREQKRAVRCDADVMLTACPGSGKTRVIISKLLRAVEDVRGTPRSVACITFTNAAVYEIEARVRHHVQPGDEVYYDICTIHSFCLNHIFRPFCHLITGFEKGFTVLTPDSEEFVEQVTAAWGEFGRYDLSYRDFQEFEQLRINSEGEPVGAAVEQGSITLDLASLYWGNSRSAGLIDFANIVYYAFCLLRDRPEILDYAASKFGWILVDEFQDTSDLQVEILSLIAARGRTRFLLVGDMYQSIYRFAGARPDLADEFARRIGARTDLRLSGNFRSSPPILEHAGRLLPRDPPMKARGPASIFTDVPRWRHGESAFELITDYFLPELEGLGIAHGEAAILAPRWFELYPLGRRLREYGVSIVGPGARPYRRRRHFAELAEQVCAYLMEADPDSIAGIERTLFSTLLNMTGRTNYDLFSYHGRVLLFRLLEEAKRLHEEHFGALEWLEAAAVSFARILVDAGYLVEGEADQLTVSAEEMKEDMVNNRIDIANLTISDLGIYAYPDAALKLSTIHFAKGREYDAVAMIDLHENRLPSYYARTKEDLQEQRRLFYVGMTRARRYLLYLTDDTGRDGPSRFLLERGLGLSPS